MTRETQTTDTKRMFLVLRAAIQGLAFIESGAKGARAVPRIKMQAEQAVVWGPQQCNLNRPAPERDLSYHSSWVASNPVLQPLWQFCELSNVSLTNFFSA